MPNYEFKPTAELVRAAALAALVFVCITATQIGSVTDWQSYATTAATGLVSAIGAAILGAITKPS